MKHGHSGVAIFAAALAVTATADSAIAADRAPLFTGTPTILVRSPDPAKLATFYTALGFKQYRVSAKGGVIFHLDGDVGSLEVVQMDKDTKPSGPKASRTQQGVVAIFETTDQAALIARAKAAGATLIEKWDASDRPVSIYYIADPENNILGFAPRHHNPNIKSP
jgi:predicted enzyme related to lactoylglutathione lyase